MSLNTKEQPKVRNTPIRRIVEQACKENDSLLRRLSKS
ncbi:hypothetical protein SAMN05421543_105183 [Alicyclobacillus macrosporangiidus]|uniref:Uncharacterized protein n=1 Tax=Alicyclobacillus macrosporangiidus TaxID=392015 RepID=A0A1I7HYY8_9BACL|nr:hypothetical protein SAMN05421543_105183 [Alicyclobacillus macrosporangiidus]